MEKGGVLDNNFFLLPLTALLFLNGVMLAINICDVT